MNEGNKNAEYISYDKACFMVGWIVEYLLEHKECKSMQKAAAGCGLNSKIIPYIKKKHGIISYSMIEAQRIIDSRKKKNK